MYNIFILEIRYHNFKTVLGSKDEGEVIKLAEEDETVQNVLPPLNQLANFYQNNLALEESQPEVLEDRRGFIDDSTQIKNGVFEFDIDGAQENYLPFLNQPRFEYYSKSDKNFDDYLDWIVENSFSNSF